MAELEEFLKKFIKNIDKVVEDSLSKGNMKVLAKKTAERMKDRTRKGKGVNFHDAPELNLKPLKASTIRLREILNSKGELHSQTTASFSNLTRSGQLLDAMRGTSKRRGTGRITFNPNRNDGKNNQKIVSEIEKEGRKFFNLSRKEVISLLNDYTLNLKKEFVKLFNKMKSR